MDSMLGTLTKPYFGIIPKYCKVYIESLNGDEFEWSMLQLDIDALGVSYLSRGNLIHHAVSLLKLCPSEVVDTIVSMWKYQSRKNKCDRMYPREYLIGVLQLWPLYYRYYLAKDIICLAYWGKNVAEQYKRYHMRDWITIPYESSKTSREYLSGILHADLCEAFDRYPPGVWDQYSMRTMQEFLKHNNIDVPRADTVKNCLGSNTWMSLWGGFNKMVCTECTIASTLSRVCTQCADSYHCLQEPSAPPAEEI